MQMVFLLSHGRAIFPPIYIMRVQDTGVFFIVNLVSQYNGFLPKHLIITSLESKLKKKRTSKTTFFPCRCNNIVEGESLTAGFTKLQQNSIITDCCNIHCCFSKCATVNNSVYNFSSLAAFKVSVHRFPSQTTGQPLQ